MLRATLALTAAVWFASLTAVARAEPAAAEALFREGRALLERGDVEAACEKLEASHAMEPSSGTLLNLATCRLKQGKTATAWAHFVSAERLARNQSRPEHEREAARRRAELEPRLSTLTLQVSETPPGLEVRWAGRVVERASFGSRIPVDPGQHRLELRAPDHAPKVVEITISGAGEHQIVALPKLEPLGREAPDAPRAAAQGTARVDAAPRDPGPGAAPWILGGVGAAALVAGGVFGVLALGSNDEAIEQCGGETSGCSDRARDTAERRDREALLSTVGVGVGIAGLGAAAVWLLSSGNEERSGGWRADGAVTRTGAFVRVRAGF